MSGLGVSFCDLAHGAGALLVARGESASDVTAKWRRQLTDKRPSTQALATSQDFKQPIQRGFDERTRERRAEANHTADQQAVP